MATHAANFKIPVPWDRNSPHFDGKSASSLKRFIRHCKMIIEQAGITDNDLQKNRISDYINDDDVREQLENLPAHATGTLDEWIAEMEELYPEIQDFGVGSLEKLRKICAANQGLERSQQGEVKRYGASFLNEANKLTKAPALASNRELVEMYLGAFEAGFTADIQSMMYQVKFWDDKNPGVIPAVGVPPAAAVQPAQPVVPPAPAQQGAGVQPAVQPAQPVVGVLGAVPGQALVVRREDTLPLIKVMGIAEAMTKSWVGVTAVATIASKVKAIEAGHTREVFPKIKEAEVTLKLESFANDIAALKDSAALHERKLQDSLINMEKNIKASFSQTQTVRETAPHLDNNNNQGRDNSDQNNQGSQDRGYSNGGNNGNYSGNRNNNNYSNGGYQNNQGNDNRGYSGDNRGYSGENRSNWNRNNNPDDRKCYYCFQEHLIRDCPWKQEHIENGKIVIENGMIKLGNGLAVPTYPAYKSRRDRVDEHYSNLDTDKSPAQALIQGYRTNLFPQYTQGDYSRDIVRDKYDCRDDELRSMLVHRNFQQKAMNSNIQPAPESFATAPSPSFIPIPAPVQGPSSGADYAQFMAYMASAHDQFVATRTGARTDAPAKPNF